MTEPAARLPSASVPVPRTASPARAAWRRFSSHRLAVVGLGIIGLFAVVALLAPWVAPADPIRQSLPDALRGPSLAFPLGTDEFGRCVLSRILFGARLSLLVGVLATGIGASLGVSAGLAAGYFNRLDGAIMRVMDVLLAFPGILLALVATFAFVARHVLSAALVGLLAVVFVATGRGTHLDARYDEHHENRKRLTTDPSHI